MLSRIKEIDWRKETLTIRGGEKILFVAFALICLVPFSHRPDWIIFGKPVSLILFMSFGLLLWALSLNELRQRRHWPLFATFSAVFIGAMIVSALLTQANRPDALKTCFGVLFRGMGPALFAFVWVAFYREEERIYQFFVILGGVIAFAALFEIVTDHYFIFSRMTHEIDWHRHYPPEKGYAVGAVGQPLPFSSLLTFLFPFSFVRAVQSRDKGAILSAALIFLAVIFTYRRSGYFLLVLTILAVLFQTQNKKQMLRLILGGLLFFIFLNLVSPSVRANVVSRFDVKTTIHELHKSHRVQSFGTVGRIFKDHPIFGFGTRQYPFLHQWYEPIMNAYETPDNQYLRFLAEGGLVGIGTFLLWLLYGLWMTFRIKTTEASVYRLALISFCLSMILIDAFYWPALQMGLWIVMGTTAGLMYAKKRQ